MKINGTIAVTHASDPSKEWLSKLLAGQEKLSAALISNTSGSAIEKLYDSYQPYFDRNDRIELGEAVDSDGNSR